MIQYIFKLGIRNLLKSKWNTFINLFCLTLGITILILIAVFSCNELSTDSFHSKAPDIYKITYGNSSGTPGPLSSLIKHDFPEIQAATHIETHQLTGLSPVISYERNAYEVTDYYSVDSSFFSIFDFEVKQGNLNEALHNPFSMILSESEAKRIFGDENPIGKTIIWKTYRDFTFTIKSVIEDPPQNSSIQYKGLITESSVKIMTPNYPDDWGFGVYETYILLHPNVIPSELESKLRSYLIDFYNKNLSNSASHADTQMTPLTLHSLTDVYFNKDLTNDTTNNGNLLLVKVLIAIGILIMMLSVINYINLATAKASIRNKEIGIMKVSGSTKSALVFQFLTETTLVSMMAVLVSFLLTLILLPLFSRFMGFESTLKLPWIFLLIAIPGTIIIGIIAGLYPAFVLSSQKILHIIKNKAGNYLTGISLRYALVAFQFIISISLITATLLIFKQVNYVKNKDLGIQQDQTIFAKLPFQIIRGKKDVLKERLLGIPGIENIAFSSAVPGQIEGLNSQEIDGKTYNFASLWVDPEFLKLYNIQLKSGRFFSEDYQSDVNSTALINESAVKEFDLEDPSTLEIRVPGGKAKVVGVIEDFNFKSLHHPIEPLVIVYLPRQGAFLNLKLSGKNISKTLAEIRGAWEELAPGIPFNYHFLNDTFEQLYKNDDRMGKAISFFSFIAILIAILGILSLSVFLCESKIKEIGIRKINGAGVSQIVLMLNRGFVYNLLFAFMISCPVTFLILSKWFDNFAYKTSMDPLIFIVSGLIIGAITLSIVTWQSWKFAATNPVDTLRHE